MSEEINSVYDFQEIDIYTKLILGKKTLSGITTLWQEKLENNIGTGIKEPLRLYVVNDGSLESESPSQGSAVKSVKLCKRSVIPDYPSNTMILPNKSRIAHRFALSVLVEYENGNFNVITLPKQLSAPKSKNRTVTSAFCASLMSDAGLPVPQQQNKTEPAEKLAIVHDATGYSSFEYRVTLPLSELLNTQILSDTDEQALQSFIHLKNLKYEAEILEPVLIETDCSRSVWTTAIDLSLAEDIAVKIGMDQDIVVRGISGP